MTLEFCGALMVVLIFVWKNAPLLAPWYLPDAIISIGTVALVTTAAATPTVCASQLVSIRVDLSAFACTVPARRPIEGRIGSRLRRGARLWRDGERRRGL